jgi:hypothetical protein
MERVIAMGFQQGIEALLQNLEDLLGKLTQGKASK